MGETSSAFLGIRAPSTVLAAKLEFRAGAPGIKKSYPSAAF